MLVQYSSKVYGFQNPEIFFASDWETSWPMRTSTLSYTARMTTRMTPPRRQVRIHTLPSLPNVRAPAPTNFLAGAEMVVEFPSLRVLSPSPLHPAPRPGGRYQLNMVRICCLITQLHCFGHSSGQVGKG